MPVKHAHITGLRYALCVLLGAALSLLLAAGPLKDDVVPPAMDAAAQRLRIEDQLVSLNARMDELLLLLRSGHVKVICLSADTAPGGVAHGRTNDPVAAPAGGPAPSSGVAR